MLKGFIPFFVGSSRVKALDLPEDRVILINNNNSLLEKIREKLFKLTLRPPRILLRQLRSLSPQLIHAHFAFDAIFALPIAEALKIPLVVSLHGYDINTNDEVWDRSQYFTCRMFPKRRLKLIRSERVQFIAVSEYIKNRAVKRGFPTERIMVHYIGVDVDKFVPTGKIPKQPIVLFIGRLVENKGCSYLIRAMNAVQTAIPTAHLVVIGDGQLRENLEAEAGNLLHSCSFTGMIDNMSVLEHMKGARIVCVPSVTIATGESEGLPVVIYEAMAMGIPVVATCCAGIPEAVIHGETGLLSPERDVTGITDNIIKLLVDDELWKTYSSNSRKYCEEHFSITKQINKLENIYSSMIR
jgi:glycosyltransferase involved in cell wall biosynthesis